MTRLFFMLCLNIFNAELVHGKSPQVYEENTLRYQDKKDANTNWVQIAVQFYASDSLKGFPKSLDVYEVSESRKGAKTFAVVRSSFYLPLGLEQIHQRMQDPVELSKYSKYLKIPKCFNAKCSATIKSTFAHISLTLRHGLVSSGMLPEIWTPLFKVLHNPDFVAAQEFTNIESVFGHGSSLSAFYEMGKDLTWVQSYQIFSVNESAYNKARLVPFLNLEKNIRSVVQDLMLDARSSILQEKRFGP